MQFALFLFSSMFAAASPAFANPACVMCMTVIGATLFFGLPLTVAGVMIGSLLLITYYFMEKFMEKIGWTFHGRQLISALVALIPAFVIFGTGMIPYGSIGFYFGIDKVMLSMASGALAFELSQRSYQFVKAKNGGRAHFPFEKVVFALAFLALTAAIFRFLP